jgi:phosphoribosyl 1,2-cyclic phosphodiesterase
VSLAIPGADPILFDFGTGLRYFGATQPIGVPFSGTCLLSHLHWDHIQGLPFFAPLLSDGSTVTVYGPTQEDGRTVQDIFGESIKPPLFPIELSRLPGTVSFVDVGDADFVIDGGPAGDIQVMSRVIPHIGRTLGFRVEWNGCSVAYLSDHQMPHDGSCVATDGALELCRDVDLLIHDAQYSPEEFAAKFDWGHCTIDFALWLARESKVRRLALFHHDPSHHDDHLDELFASAVIAGARCGIDVFGAAEGRTVVVGG